VALSAGGMNHCSLRGNARVGRSGGGNGSVQPKKRHPREESGNGVNSSTRAALLPIQTKLRAILDQDRGGNLSKSASPKVVLLGITNE
jgi:hypothetical protein